MDQEQMKDGKKVDLEFVVYPILLLLSRMSPVFNKMDLQEEEEEQANHSYGELNIREFVVVIKECAGFRNYYVRKVAASALLPFIHFDHIAYMKQLQAYVEELK
jgi:hypothetical protein